MLLLPYFNLSSFPFSSTVSNSPDSGNPMVESTSKTVAPDPTLVKSWVFGLGLNFPKIVPLLKSISLW